MKKILIALVIGLSTLSTTKAMTSITIPAIVTEKFDIKIKNDSGYEVAVINEGSGGTYRLTKNAITTIKMENGDKLYIYKKGKKGKLLLTATKDLSGKIQLFSKL